MENIEQETGLINEIVSYEKSTLPIFKPNDVKFVKPSHKIIYSLIHLKIGRANYLSKSQKDRIIWGSQNSDQAKIEVSETDKLRLEAKVLLSLLQLEVTSTDINQLLAGKHEIPTGTYGLISGYPHY